MEQFALHITSHVGRPVIDKTGLTGSFDYELRWTPDEPSPDGGAARAGGPSIFAAVEEQLGLKLEPQRGPVEVLVIDSIERPTPN